MSESIVADRTLKPILDILFGIGAIIMFAELVPALRRAASSRFSAGQVVQVSSHSFVFVVCLDWVAGFDFFKDTIAHLAWNLLSGSRN